MYVCMRFVHYDDDVLEGSGADCSSIICKSERWPYEDCIEDVVKDNLRIKQFCSFYADKFTI